jgi:hypothetical protein
VAIVGATCDDISSSDEQRPRDIPAVHFFQNPSGIPHSRAGIDAIVLLAIIIQPV